MLDLPTFLLIIGIGNLSFAGLMGAYARGPVAQPALRTWMWARVSLGICQLASVLNLRLESPFLAQIIATGWFCGIAIEAGAYFLFFGFSHWRRILYPATGVAVAVVAIAQASGVTVHQTIPIIATIVGLYSGGMGAMLLLPRVGAPGLQRIIGVNDMILAVAALAWVCTGFGEGHAPSRSSAAIQSFAFFTGYVLMIVKGFGFLLLCKQEDDRKMLHLATVDSLTGLLNRYAFFEKAQALRTAQMSVLMLDLDHFKRINDRFGHATGDAALRLFSHTVQTVLAGRGVVGRMGGEEFALALPVALDDALDVGEQLRAAVAAALLPVGGEPYVVTVSIGVAGLHAGEELTQGLARADQALYVAKHGGRNRVEQYRPALQAVEVEPARLQNGGVGVAGQHDGILAGPQARQQFFA